MTFPKLLFKDLPTPAVTPADVITDLKLDLLLGEEVTRFLLLRPEKETFLLRQEMFSLMLRQEEAHKLVKDLKTTLGKAKKLYKAHNVTLSDKASSYIFAYLFKEYADFCRSAIEMKKYGELAKRFALVFENVISNEEFINAENDVVDVISALAEVSSVTIKTDGENSKIARECESDISESLKKCANEMGIPLRKKQQPEVALQKDITEAAAKLYPEQFAKASEFASRYRPLISGEIFDYSEELEFINGIIEFTNLASSKGIPYSFPELSENKEISFSKVYDVTLLKKEGTVIVPNDVEFTEKEPFFYLTGANGGGKTTYIRTVGNAVLLFMAGAPVFCESGRGTLLSACFTHFPRDERFEGTGRFLDERNRADEILEKQNGSSLVLLNETFATTGEDKAVLCTNELAHALYKSGSFGLYITHQHDVDESVIPFLGVMIDVSDSNRRTYRIEKRRLPPKSFARDILEKYGLTRSELEKKFNVTTEK